MRTTIDKAGRLVIPTPLRDAIGLRPGEVIVTVVGAALHIEPVFEDQLVERDSLLLLSDADQPLSAEELRDARLVDQR